MKIFIISRALVYRRIFALNGLVLLPDELHTVGHISIGTVDNFHLMAKLKAD